MSEDKLKAQAVIAGTIPVLLYGIVFWIMVVALRNQPGEGTATFVRHYTAFGFVPALVAGYVAGGLAAGLEIRHALATGGLVVVLRRLILLAMGRPLPLALSVVGTEAFLVLLVVAGGYLAVRKRRRAQLEAAGPINEASYLAELETKKRQLGKGCLIVIVVIAALIGILLLLPI